VGEGRVVQSRVAATLLVASILVAVFSAFAVAGALTNSSPGIRSLPIAVSNLDRGTTYNGRHVNFGSQAIDRITRSPALRGVVAWSLLSSRARLVAAMDDDKDYAGLVIPADYSTRLAALLKPGASPRAPGTLEILTSPAAGPSASSAATGILLTATGMVASATAHRNIETLSRMRVRVTPQAAQLFVNPVRVTQTVVEPAPSNTGRGGAPFYVALMVLLTSILGTTMLSQGIDALNRGTATRGTRPSEIQTWRRKMVFALIFCVLASLIQTWIVVGILGVPASSWVAFLLFTMLCLVTISAITLFWHTLAGARGIVLTILFAIALGVPASGGTTPVQMLPDFYQWLHSWVPLRFIVDGYRSVILFHGRAAAGLRTATIALLIESILLAAVAGGISIVKDRRQSGSRPQVPTKAPELASIP
jgi:uncharacterized phage infection (PIP) family protein YhgE